MVHDLDAGLLSPVTVGHDAAVSDAALLSALVGAEIALVRAGERLGLVPAEAAEEIAARGEAGIDLAELTSAAVAGGNPVIPLVVGLRAGVSDSTSSWIHRGATSQDILDTALMMIAVRARTEILAHLDRARRTLRDLAGAHRDTVAVARTLTQHAVPTTLGARAATWLGGVDRAAKRLSGLELPAQLAGAGGTLASFVEIAGTETAARFPLVFAEEAGLAPPPAPWHVMRWPVTELGDALVQSIDALAKIAADVATLSRTEIGELAEGVGGGSSAMPQKRNPTASVLVRSAGIRAPHLGATLHAAAALAVDERPDGAWHAEWPVLRELLRLTLGAAATAAEMLAGLRVDAAAVTRSLGASGGLILSERLALALTPLIGRERTQELLAAAGRGEDLAGLLRALPEEVDATELLDPARYTGLATGLADRAASEQEQS